MPFLPSFLDVAKRKKRGRFRRNHEIKRERAKEKKRGGRENREEERKFDTLLGEVLGRGESLLTRPYLRG